MKPEDHFLFLATRQNPDAADQQRMEDFVRNHSLNWEMVFAVAGKQGVGPLIYENVSRKPALLKCIPEAVLSRAKLGVIRNAFIKQERFRYLAEDLRFLRERDIRAIIIKGASLDLLVYDQPWYTDYNDIDLILSVRREDLPERTVREIGHHFHRKRVEYDFYEHHDFNMNGMIPVDFDAVWQNAQAVQIAGEDAFILSPEDQLLSICINSCRKRFFRLKALLDIRETIIKTPGLDWNKFAKRSREFHCGNIVYTALYVTNQVLRLHLPNGLLTRLGISLLHRMTVRFNVHFLMVFWSLAATQSKLRPFNRVIDPRLILPYATYHTDQILHKAQEFGEVRRE